VFRKFTLEDGFQHMPQRRLHHAIPNRWYAQWSFLVAAGFGYPCSSDRVWLVLALSQFFFQPQKLTFVLLVELRNCLPVHSRTATISPNCVKRTLKIPRSIDLVNQPEPFASFDSVFQSHQHALRPNTQFHPRPAVADVSRL
jgi:hypothetical protein